MKFDLVVRQARIATASDTFMADIGIATAGSSSSALHSTPARARSTRRDAW